MAIPFPGRFLTEQGKDLHLLLQEKGIAKILSKYGIRKIIRMNSEQKELANKLIYSIL